MYHSACSDYLLWYLISRGKKKLKHPKTKKNLFFSKESMNVVQTRIIGSDDFFCFFFRKSLKIYSGANSFFCGLTFDFFLSSVHFSSFVERTAKV